MTKILYVYLIFVTRVKCPINLLLDLITLNSITTPTQQLLVQNSNIKLHKQQNDLREERCEQIHGQRFLPVMVIFIRGVERAH